MSMRTRRSLHTVIVALLVSVVGQTWMSEHKDNDGDSFRVRCGDKEFRARLYFVDAPETTLTYAEGTHEQSLHFGITLDETMVDRPLRRTMLNKLRLSRLF
jgi:hypothetical protein